jgi:hypothetical protein
MAYTKVIDLLGQPPVMLQNDCSPEHSDLVSSDFFQRRT